MNCLFCGKELKKYGKSHQTYCKLNPNRKKTYNEDWNEEKRSKHSKIMKEKNTNAKRVYSEEQRAKISIRSKETNLKYWTAENKKKQSDLMKQIVLNKPESYSSKNVCVRTKSIEFVDSFGNNTKLSGNWELIVAEHLNSKNIKWTNKIKKPFNYFWNEKWHFYFPDFYLPELNVYIEVKGFERERDRMKWKYFPEKLFVLKLKEIQNIINGTFNILDYIGLI